MCAGRAADAEAGFRSDPKYAAALSGVPPPLPVLPLLLLLLPALLREVTPLAGGGTRAEVSMLSGASPLLLSEAGAGGGGGELRT
jgi:hypothetical protein